MLTGHFEGQGAGQAAQPVVVDEAQLKRAVVALRVMVPGALRPIEDLIPILYPGARLGYGGAATGRCSGSPPRRG